VKSGSRTMQVKDIDSSLNPMCLKQWMMLAKLLSYSDFKGQILVEFYNLQ